MSFNPQLTTEETHKLATLFGMKGLPKKARIDKMCVKCLGKSAITRDGLLCLCCLKVLIKELTPDFRDLSRYGTDQTGRPARSTAILGGSATTVGDGDDPGLRGW